MKKKVTSKKCVSTKCFCRKPQTRHDCTYCGTGTASPEGAVCGVCHEAGIDGPVIRGSERRTCCLHLKKIVTQEAERQNRLTIKQFCNELYKAAALIDKALDARKIQASISEEAKCALLNISDSLCDLGGDIELGDL